MTLNNLTFGRYFIENAATISGYICIHISIQYIFIYIFINIYENSHEV